MQAGPVEGAVFADYGSDLGSGSTVPGNAVFYLRTSKCLRIYTIVDLRYVIVIYIIASTVDYPT